MMITIAVSAYASEKYLGACLENLLTQTIIDQCEVMVVDSGSPEDERSICDAYQRRFPHLRYLRTERETLYAAWNRALASARGKFFVNANTDDALHPEALSILASALRRHPNAALAYGDWVRSPVPNAAFPWDPSFRRVVHEPYHPKLALFYAYAGCHQFWRASTLRAIGGFPSARHAAGDYEVLCWLVSKRYHAVYVPTAVSAFYQNPEGISRRDSASYREFREIRDQLRETVAIEDIFSVGRSGQARSNAWMALADYALTMKVPWYNEIAPDIDFAMLCVDRALEAWPLNATARDYFYTLRHTPAEDLMAAMPKKITHMDPSGRESLLSRFVSRGEPRPRVPSPIFHSRKYIQ
jgi:glycosyltransferase involved in cell wall biosynthesis